MKFVVRSADAPGIPGGKAVLLCDEAGKPVAKQRHCVIENGVDQVSTITVTFIVDGDTIRFAD